MIVARDTEELEAALADRNRGSVALVPTMGALHQGHLSLVAKANEIADTTVATVFLNPTQFRPDEDLATYPQNERADIEALSGAACDVLFLPSVETVYPQGFATTVSVDQSLTDKLCGAVRGPQHFDGVTTVLARLFSLISADKAVFGAKDWQQCVVVTRMAADLFPRLKIVVSETVREPDGLAMSSRNAYLKPHERDQAAAVPASLMRVVELAGSQKLSQPTDQIVAEATELLSDAGLETEYLQICDPTTLEAIPVLDRPARAFVAARAGTTRLIDNLAVAAPTTKEMDDVSPSD